MWSELTGLVPKLPPDYAKTLINRAWRDVRRQNLWSFLLFEGNWTSPGLLNTGTATVTQGSNQVVFNAAAATAIGAIGFYPSTVTQRQFRVGVGTIYNIWGWNAVTSTITLDRPYQESSAANIAYTIYQVYYAAPMKDFWQWITVRDMVNYNDLVTTTQRSAIDARDPQRTIYYIPTNVVPYQMDMNPASSTYTWPMFELWGQPSYILTYQLYGLRKGAELVNPTDILPPQVGEDCVMARARALAYEWSEANKQDSHQEGADFRFLMGEAMNDYKRLFSEYRRQDRAYVDNFRTKLRRTGPLPNLFGWYNSIAGYASPGAAWG